MTIGWVGQVVCDSFQETGGQIRQRKTQTGEQGQKFQSSQVQFVTKLLFVIDAG